ncbi:polysaccharide pyruvyl transferase family protein [Kordia sp. YSTF-M3]|uniref:Polysaccharide pyruvyl transferase family protein n=1 Tax=Kordia aestuariivivens TaxID=2759037 RepID=A0ABR7Q679_9FLAO|nr:polysaccharide pyruvyl transferase family protein [Kordia aestuariivivens]MBC8754079.1 polysaccharide pyruvyl transferase family protein [Kordia aestuariivivens]
MIRILTFFDCYNYGAYLQAYALHKFLIANGLENEFLNYRSKKSIKNEFNEELKLGAQNFILRLRILGKVLNFKRHQRKLKRTKPICVSTDLKNIKSDKVIIGSDQIWCYTQEWGGLDTTYFSDNINAETIIAYAASLGPDNFDKQHPRSILRLMKNFKHVGARDHNTLNFAKLARPDAKKGPHLVLDPTLIYNFNKEIKEPSIKNYIIFYSDKLEPSQDVIASIKKIAKEKNLTIISLGKPYDWCDKNIITLSPFQWMGYMKNANMVVTCMFHGLLFSVKFQRDFMMFLNSHRKNKCLDFLKRINLENRVIEKSEDVADLFNTNIDYKPINSILKTEIEYSQKFLLNSLADK